MSRPHATIETAWDPAMIEHIERLVAAKVTEKFDALQAQAAAKAASGEPATGNRASIIVFSPDLDKVMAAFVIAGGAAAMGMEVTMYFTFWGLSAIRRKTLFRNKSIAEKLLGVMLPSGPASLGMSKLNMLGVGPAFLKSLMKKKNIQTLPDLIRLTRETGVRFVACQMSMDVMGVQREELIDGIQYGGVATYLADARDSRITLFI